MQPRPGSGDGVAPLDVARLAGGLRDVLAGLHSDVRVVESPVDFSAEFRGVIFCRIAPYRELLHIQVGHDSLWETRLHRTDELPEVTARIVRAFLDVFAKGGTGPA